MAKTIKKVGVIGAGTMGRGIAAQLANAGVEVVMLDLTKERADEAITLMLKAKPTDAFNAGFMHPKNAKLITTGSSIEDLELLKDCDWVVESILVPDNKIRQDLYKKIQNIVSEDCIFSSNTSMDQTADMTEDQDDDFKSRFLNTHFFNPVRFMHLLEIIPSEHTDPEATKAIAEFGDKVAGKKIVYCKDERGFIANRIGMYAIERVIAETASQNTKIEDVDAIMGQAFGFPALGMFKLADEVGLDVVDHVRTDLHETLPETDAFQKSYTPSVDIKKMLEEGYLGNRKEESKGGFYRKKTDADGNLIRDERGKPLKEARDVITGEYRDFEKSPFFRFEKQIKKIGGFQKFFDSDHNAAKFSWPVMRDVLLYVLDHAEELAYDVQSVDEAMRAGYNWEYGPFELLDKFGVEWFTQKLESEGIEVPDLLAKAEGQSFYQVHDQQLKVRHFDGSFIDIKREDGIVNLDDIKRRSEPLITHNSASLWDIGDGVTCLEFKSEQNSMDPSVLYVINESIKLIEESDKYKAMVIYNDGERFSVGANLTLAEVFKSAAENDWSSYERMLGKAMTKRLTSWAPKLGIPEAAEKGLKNFLHEMVFQGQAIYTALKQSSFPVVGAPKGTPKNMSLGGGCEILLNCDAVQSGPEQVIGLPESGLGLLPAWTGATRYLERALKDPRQPKGPMPAVIKAALALANPMSSMATNAQEAKSKMWLKPDDGITMNPDRVLADAKAKALAMAENYKPEPLPTFSLPGLSGKGAIRMNVDDMYMKGGDPKKGNVNHIDLKVFDRIANVLTGGERLERDEVDHHVVDHKDYLKELIDKKPKGYLDINTTIKLNYSRMMQLERQGIYDAFNEYAETWPRVRKLLATNSYLREDRLDPAPSVKEIRDSMESHPLPYRNIDGKPLTGKDAEKLESMANMTQELYKLNRMKGPGAATIQVPRTFIAIRRTFGLF